MQIGLLFIDTWPRLIMIGIIVFLVFNEIRQGLIRQKIIKTITKGGRYEKIIFRNIFFFNFFSPFAFADYPEKPIRIIVPYSWWWN